MQASAQLINFVQWLAGPFGYAQGGPAGVKPKGVAIVSLPSQGQAFEILDCRFVLLR